MSRRVRDDAAAKSYSTDASFWIHNQPILNATLMQSLDTSLSYPALKDIVPSNAAPDLNEVREFAAKLHSMHKAWAGEALGWPAEYNPERPKPPLDSNMTFTPAVFCIGESGIWFFSLMWEHGRDEEPVEFLSDRNIVRVVAEDNEEQHANLIDDLLEHPLKIQGFQPLTRDEAHTKSQS